MLLPGAARNHGVAATGALAELRSIASSVPIRGERELGAQPLDNTFTDSGYETAGVGPAHHPGGRSCNGEGFI
jgi:hypothetical protein